MKALLLSSLLPCRQQKYRQRRDDEKRKTRSVGRKVNSARKKLEPRRTRIRKQSTKPSSKNIEVISSLKLMNHGEESPANAHCSFLQPVSVHCLTKRGAGPTCKVLRTSYI